MLSSETIKLMEWPTQKSLLVQSSKFGSFLKLEGKLNGFQSTKNKVSHITFIETRTRFKRIRDFQTFKLEEVIW